jgi:ubiquinone/menaquinone biosynthesis C-methylase UbiE
MKPIKTTSVKGVPVTTYRVADSYHAKRYVPERQMILAMTNFMEWFLRVNPDLPFESKRNLSRHMAYLPPGIRAWTAYMPGGIATYHVHNPHITKLLTGKKLDYLTRALFRHSYDARGVRTRLYVLAELAKAKLETCDTPVWLSIAAGTGKPVFDAVKTVPIEKRHATTLYITDRDESTLEFAKTVYADEHATAGRVIFEVQDVLANDVLPTVVSSRNPDIIDCTGLFEYLSPEDAVRLLRELYRQMKPGAILFVTNMSPAHPHLQVHKRGLGWPGVRQRTVGQFVDLCMKAQVPATSISAHRSSDSVYNVYRIEKS